MIIIACVDEKNGMMFHHRRQSRDSVVCRDILRECGGKKLYLSVYSAKLFEAVREDREVGISEGMAEAELRISEDILNQAGDEDACFIEDTDIAGFEGQIQKVILYKWNRRYPTDRYFPLDLSDGAWELLRTEEMKGSSHERITKEIYVRGTVKGVFEMENVRENYEEGMIKETYERRIAKE